MYYAMLELIRDPADARPVTLPRLEGTTANPDYWGVTSHGLAPAWHDYRWQRSSSPGAVLHAELMAAARIAGTIRDDVPADLLADQLARWVTD